MDETTLNNINKKIWEHISKPSTSEQTAAQLINELVIKFPKYDLNTYVNSALKLTLLHINSMHSRPNIVQGLITQKVQVDKPDLNKRTALHYAAMSGNIDTINILLQNGGDINAQTIGGETPIIKAAQFNEQNAVVYFISKNADTTIKNSIGQTVSDILKISHPIVYQQVKKAFPEKIF